MMKWVFLFLLLTPALWLQGAKVNETDAYVAAVKKVTDIMVNDVTSPVAAARYYAYTNLAAYETIAGLKPKKFPSLLTLPAAKKKQLFSSAVLALWKAAQALLPSGSQLKPAIDSLAALLPPANVQLVDQVVLQITTWAGQDGFMQLNNLKRYTPKRGPEYWQPTPPAFMAPIEPHWNTIRPFMMNSANQFLTSPPVKYDLAPDAPFYKLAYEVYSVVNEKDREKIEIAKFWDCNPYEISQIGHVEFGLKKISPGGHWVGIAGIACKTKDLPFEKTVLTHALLAVALHDAFIACWDEKYRSDRVRPETVIQQHIDRSWKPVLQTPPFPEYVSGHSVASTASSVVLTAVFGRNFAFTDDTEVAFGLPVRSFQSFEQAANEASISRLYGGIHYRDAIDQAIWQGGEVGKLVRSKLDRYFDLLR